MLARVALAGAVYSSQSFSSNRLHEKTPSESLPAPRNLYAPNPEPQTPKSWATPALAQAILVGMYAALRRAPV